MYEEHRTTNHPADGIILGLVLLVLAYGLVEYITRVFW